ncbi:hypothetical protein [Thiomicrorhabdus sp.]|uniref:hypothetical protein n=1 Tax=Thiomicrorhabdus sp. TaxID=2039724 RepID=UPI0029C87C93|nr:hypothetical protein [Thiomicrorhabdus sp.]
MTIVTPEIVKTAHVKRGNTLAQLHQAKAQIERFKSEASQNPEFRYGYQVVFEIPSVSPFPNSAYSFPDSSVITQFFSKMPMNLKPKMVAYDPLARSITIKGFFVDFLLTMMIEDFYLFSQHKSNNQLILN